MVVTLAASWLVQPMRCLLRRRPDPRPSGCRSREATSIEAKMPGSPAARHRPRELSDGVECRVHLGQVIGAWRFPFWICNVTLLRFGKRIVNVDPTKRARREVAVRRFASPRRWRGTVLVAMIRSRDGPRHGHGAQRRHSSVGSGLIAHPSDAQP